MYFYVSEMILGKTVMANLDRIFNGKKTISLISGAGKTGQLLVKE